VVAGTTLVLLQMPREAVQADPEVRDFLEHLERTLPLVRPTPPGWIVAFPGDRSPEELHPPPAAAGHGHSRALLPSPGVLRPPRRRGRLERRELDDREHQLLGTLDGASAERELEGLGGSPGGGGEPQP